MTRTRARLTVGEVLDGAQCGQLRVQGCLLYKEWDEEDRGFSYWEEWELAGSDRREYWVEVDHDSDAVSLYERLPAADVIDPAWLDADRSVVLVGSLAGRWGRVAERGVGVVEQVLGRTTGSASPGEPMIYATVRLAGHGVPAEVTFENRRGAPAARLPQARPVAPGSEACARPGHPLRAGQVPTLTAPRHPRPDHWPRR